jgi:DASS family divalent anion:Na+ symporter
MRLAIVTMAAAMVWLAVPAPAEMAPEGWQLFIIFMATIASVIVGALPIFVAAIGALVLATLTSTLTPAQAFAGFSDSLILLIVVAFLIARAVAKSGLGDRIAYMIIARLGRTTMGLAYSMVATDLLIAPAFPSNTARSGVLFPIVRALAIGAGSRPDDASRRTAGAYLMMVSMAGLSISSTLWLTAMSANPIGVGIASDFGVEITFGSWLLGASVPALLAFALIPYLLHRVFPPDLVNTPEAPRKARRLLEEMGPLSAHERIMTGVFIGVVLAWALAPRLGINNAVIAFAGFFVVMVTGVLSVRDIHEEGGTLIVFMWFAILYTLSRQLDELGVMDYLGDHITRATHGLSWPAAYFILLVSYVLLHYLFVSQTAHLVAVFPVYMAVGVAAGVPPMLMALMLLFATNFFSCVTPQGSSGNVIFVGSGYLRQKEVYRYGGMVTLANLLIFGVIGTAWILLVF